MGSAKTLTILCVCCVCLTAATASWADFVGVVPENAKKAERPGPTFGTIDDLGAASRPAGGPVCGDGVCDKDNECPASSCADFKITQSKSMEIIAGAGIACGGRGTTTPNAWARCFNLENEGFVGDVVITSVDFGTESDLRFDVPVFANIYVTNLGCPASGFGTPDTVLIGIAETVAGPADAGGLINAEFGIPVEVASGSTIIVEMEVLADGDVEGFGLRPGANSEGQCGASSIRTAACGIPDWIDAVSLGFPNFHLVLRANGSTEECGVPGGGEDCENCPEDCGPDCGGCGDGICERGEDCETCPEDCGPCNPCGDGFCDCNEDSETCPEDCGRCLGCADCGDGICEPGGGGCPSDCCIANNTPGCDCPECQAAVCAIDPFCCDVSWDSICAGEAADLCGDLCVGGEFMGCGADAGGEGEDCESCPEDCGPCLDCGGCPTDSSGDGSTGAADLAALLACWGPAVPGCECFDADENGDIGAADLATLLANWGPCP